MTNCKKISSSPEIRLWNNLEIIKISDVDYAFAEWLYGQTLPYIEEMNDPSDWAFLDDYERWISGSRIFD